MKDCKYCHGMGEIIVQVGRRRVELRNETCPKCRGSGVA